MLRSPLRLIGGLPPAVRILIVGTFVNKLGSFIVPYLSIVLSREFHLSPSKAGALLFAYGAGSIVSIVTGGFLTDRLGRRLTLMVSLFGSGAVAIVMGLAPSLGAFASLLVLLGFLADLYRPAASSIVGDLLPSAHRAVGFAGLRAAVNLGFAVGMALGGLLADWNWRLLFLGDGLTTLLYAALVYLYIPETGPEARGREARSGPPPHSASPWRDGVFLQLSLTSFLFGFIFFLDFTVLPLTITVSAGYPAAVYGMLVGMNGLLIALFEVSVVEGLKPYRRLRVAALGMALNGLGFGLVAVAMHWAWFLLAVLIWTAGEILCAPQQLSFIADWAPPASRGRYLGLFGATYSLAFALNPIVFLPLHARLGETFFWPLMPVLAAPAILLLLRLDRAADHPERLRGFLPAGAPEASALPAPVP